MKVNTNVKKNTDKDMNTGMGMDMDIVNVKKYAIKITYLSI
jgi:hypothetical protein